MRSTSLRLMLLGAALVATTACATRAEWDDWKAHRAHFASEEHLEFSVRNQSAPPFDVTEQDAVLAREQGWWGGPFDPRPSAEVAGRWTGTWSGHGVFAFPFGSRAEAEFVQVGQRGLGRLALADALTMDVPEAFTLEGGRGVRVVFEVSGSTVYVRHALGGERLAGVFTIEGDRMVGRLRGSSARIVLTRIR